MDHVVLIQSRGKGREGWIEGNRGAGAGQSYEERRNRVVQNAKKKKKSRNKSSRSM